MRHSSATNGYSLQEHRLLGYNWNTERVVKETAVYAKDIDNPVDGVLKAGAAGVHVITGIGDAVLGDVVRLIQGKDNRVELEEYKGVAPRLKLDGKEALQSIGNVFRGKFASILALPVIALKTIGDAAADGADAIAGVNRN